jgi:membrane protein
MGKMYTKFRSLRWVRILVMLTRKIILPGFDGMPLYNVLAFFVRGLMNGAITTRASSVAFKFFVALFPAIIFFFTLIPYVPIENFQMTLLQTVQGVLPENFYRLVDTTIQDILLQHHGGLLSVGFVLALYFASNGILGMITAFNNTTHSIETRSVFKKYLISIVLVLIIVVILMIAITAIIAGTSIINYFFNHHLIGSRINYYLLKVCNWTVVVLMVFFVVSFIYYLAPARKTRFRFISAGSTLATFLFIGATAVFNYYFDHFSNYNALYGSIGSLLMIMMWFYFNSVVLIIGFELNASIAGAKKRKEEASLPPFSGQS